MKIAVVAPTYLPSRRANTIQVMKVCQAMVILGHSVRLAVPLPREMMDKILGQPTLSHLNLDDKGGWEQIAEHYGLHERFDVEWLPSTFRWRSYDYAWRALNWARSWGAELMYTRHPQTAAFASLMGFPTVFELHDIPQRNTAQWLLRLFRMGKGAQRLVVISQNLALELNRHFKLPLPGSASFVMVAPDGVDLQRYAELPPPGEARRRLLSLSDMRPTLPVEGFTAGYSGHLYPGRGIEVLLALAKNLPSLNFFIVGGEPAVVDSLRAEVKQAGLHNVFISGFVPNAHLPLYQAACEVLLMPYQRRVAASSGGDIAPYLSPMKDFEYLACGRVILSSDLPVLREVLNERNAILLPPEEANVWVETLRSVAEEPLRYTSLALQARRDSQRYTWESRMQRILDGITPNTQKTVRVGS